MTGGVTFAPLPVGFNGLSLESLAFGGVAAERPGRGSSLSPTVWVASSRNITWRPSKVGPTAERSSPSALLTAVPSRHSNTWSMDTRCSGST